MNIKINNRDQRCWVAALVVSLFALSMALNSVIEPKYDVVLAWDGEPDCDYIVHWRRNHWFSLPHSRNVGRSRKCDLALTRGASYSFYVTARRGNEESSPSKVLEIKVPAAIAPKAVKIHAPGEQAL